MKTIWLTDIHLEFLESCGRSDFYRTLKHAAADTVLITGDIGQAPTTFDFLVQMQTTVGCPVYFVFGNHDFYFGTIEFVRSQARQLFTAGHLRWLGGCGIVKLTENTCCIGHDGWGDSRNGDYARSHVLLNDFELINELAGLPRSMRQKKLLRLGDEAATHFKTLLPQALTAFRHIVVLTHVPPFPESAWWQGQPCNPDWLPFFSCKATGDVLGKAMEKHPDKHMTVLCGHTHGSGTVQILPNLTVHTGFAQYGTPDIQRIFELE